MSDSASTTPAPNGHGPELSVSEAATLLGISEDTVRAHLRQGTLPGEKHGNRWVVHLAEPPHAAATSPEPDRLLAEATASDALPDTGWHVPPALRHLVRRLGVLWRRMRALVAIR